ncbi:MAG: hypothetical protein AB7N76_34720 [Planctomycetota bacterium]
MTDRDDLPQLPDEQHDPVLELLRAHRPEAPADLADRVLAELTGPLGERRRFWREAERAAGGALLASAAAALLTTGLAFWSAGSGPAPAVARRPAPPAATNELPVAQAQTQQTQTQQPSQQLSGGEELALAGPEAALTLQGYWLLGEGE